MSVDNNPAPAGETTWHTTILSVIGELTLVRDGHGLRGLYFPHHWHRPEQAAFGPASPDGFAEADGQLKQYLAGSREGFDLALTPHGEQFHHRVWEHVARIGYGQIITYGDLAAQLGGDVTAQQVGAAVARNPLSIFIPCHRVLGRGGKLTGYAGGIPRKRHLLELEAAHRAVLERTPFQQALLAESW